MNIIIEPHPDDAFWGCFSLLKLGLIDGVITVSDGGLLPGKYLNKISVEEYTKTRLEENQNMAKYFGITNLVSLGFPDGLLEMYLPLIQKSINIPGGVTIYLPHLRERHSDHRAVSQLKFPGCKIIEYCVWDWIPDYDVHMSSSEQFRFKKQLFKQLYPSQYKILPWSKIVHDEYFKVRKCPT
jgi:LmbE family N-acetylglucosaminyl deacetylase